MVYYGYTLNRSNTLSSSEVNGTCYFLTNTRYCDGTCKNTAQVLSSDGVVGGVIGVSFNPGTTAYCTEKQNHYEFTSYSTYGEYNINNMNDICVYGNPYSNWDSCLPSEQAKVSKVYITSEQTSTMGNSFITAGSGLLHIGIQLMPYAIAFVVLTFVFTFIFKLAQRLSGRRYQREWEEAEKRYKKEKANSYDSWSDYDQDPFR